MDINSFVIGFKKGKASVPAVELNIAYGETAPEDTTKLWVKTTQPSGVVVSPNVEYEVLEGDSITTLTETLPRKNYNMASATVGSKVYMFGGNGGLWQSIVCFDSETKIITTLSATLPTPLAAMACASSGTKIYLFGGSLADRSYTTSEAIYCFDTETEQLTTLSAKITTATQIACAKYGSGIYLFGGQYWSYFSSNYKDYYRNAIQCFNIETETVTTLPVTIPSSRASMACACVGSKVYLFGGYYSSNTYSTIYRFDIETGTMAILASTLPKTLRYTRAEPLGDKIYLFGGSNGSAYYNTIICFDTKTETCEELPMNIGDARGKMGTSVVGETIYLFGGERDDSTTSCNTIQQFEGVTKVPVVDSGAIHIVPQLTENFFPFLNTDTVKAEIGVDSVLKGNADGHGELVEAALYKDGAWVTI